MVIYVGEGTIWEPRSLCRTESHHDMNDRGGRSSAIASTSSPAPASIQVLPTARHGNCSTADHYDRDHAALAVLLGLHGLRVSEASATNVEDLAARHADPSTTTIDDRRRQNFDHHTAYAVIAFVAGGRAGPVAATTPVSCRWR
jgi:hypothetical protein